MTRRILLAAAIGCLAASTAQAVCPAKSTTEVRATDLVTLELQAMMGSRQALEDAGKSLRGKGTIVYDRQANTRQFCDGTNWVSMEGGAGGGGESTPPPSTRSCSGRTLYWGGGCSGSTSSKSHGQSVSFSQSKDRDPTACTYRYAGSVTFTCNDSNFTITSGGSCSRYWTGCR